MNQPEIANVIAENTTLIITWMEWLFGVIAAAFVLAVSFSWKMAMWASEIKHDVSELKTDVSELKTDVSELKHQVYDINNKITHIDCHLVRLDTYDSQSPAYESVSKYTQASSPLTLTPEGERMVKDSSFHDVLKNHEGIFDGIIANAKGRPDLEAFIEKAAFEKVAELFDDDNIIVAAVAQFMYENGMRQSKLVYNGAIRAFSVAARDFIFIKMKVEPPIPHNHSGK